MFILKNIRSTQVLDGLPGPVLLPATHYKLQIWIWGQILPHFDVRTISVASKLKELQIFFWKKYYSYDTILSKRRRPLCSGDVESLTLQPISTELHTLHSTDHRWPPQFRQEHTFTWEHFHLVSEWAAGNFDSKLGYVGPFCDALERKSLAI